ncbi:CHAD domain-containing protein [Xylanimonas sp. McL0601]|uniref:CHAD domain-containing protein n=1 Tax=Xylanimonas sp. McL0601 TaxID=3414739 RepID=UPI003CEDBF78
MGTTAGTLLTEHLRAQVAALAAAEDDLAWDGSKGVHDARVATRRLRAALTELPRLLADDDVDDLRQRLKDWSGLLGESRDLEVQLARLEELGDHVARLRALDTLGPRLEQARAAAVEHLGTPEHTGLRTDLDLFATHPPFTRKAEHAWDDELPRGARKAARRMARRADRAVGKEGPELDAALHRVRKAARRARYAAEIVARGSGGVASEAADSAERFARVQEVLGRQHDAAVLREVLTSLRAAAVEAGEDPAPYDVLAAAEFARATSSLTTLVLVPTPKG